MAKSTRADARMVGYDFRAGSLAFQLPNGSYDVYCTTCSQHLGTFTGEVLARAILHNLDRGGVRCPECRRKTCQFCYVMQENAKHLKTFFAKDKKVKNICSVCTLEMEHSARVLNEYKDLDAAMEEIEEDWDEWVERSGGDAKEGQSWEDFVDGEKAENYYDL